MHCLGDALVDEYCDVKVSRISPEFPMPIMWSPGETYESRPGGVANVAYQFRHFNVGVSLHCFRNSYSDAVFGNHRLFCWPGTFLHEWECHTPIKRRYLDGGVQVVRHDIEAPLCGMTKERINQYYQHLARELENRKASEVEHCDVVILSDYDKGFFSGDGNYLDLFKGVKTIVDPKNGPLSKWKGCTVFKPNAKEAAALSGLSDPLEQARFFQKELECQSVVITFGGEKVVGVDGDVPFQYCPTRVIENIGSVVGAGDCFCAFFAMAIGHNFSVPEAAEIAWNAGAVYVMGRMNRPIIPAELSIDGIVEPEDLAGRDFKLVFTNGCFDLLHEGHIKTLEFAKEKGDKLVVALNTDDSVRRLKGEGRPVMPLEQRMIVMSNLKPVDFVVSFDEDTPLEVLKKIKPDVLVKGADYSTESIVGHDFVPRVYRAPILPGLSSSNFIRRAS